MGKRKLAIDNAIVRLSNFGNELSAGVTSCHQRILGTKDYSSVGCLGTRQIDAEAPIERHASCVTSKNLPKICRADSSIVPSISQPIG